MNEYNPYMATEVNENSELTVRELFECITQLIQSQTQFLSAFKSDVVEVLNSANIEDDGVKRQVIEMIANLYDNREITIQQTLALYEKMYNDIKKTEKSE